MKPTYAAIAGGVTAGSLKATDAAEKLDAQIAAIRAFVEQNRGELQLLERVRNVRTLDQGRDGHEPVFDLVQRLTVLMPADSALDSILQHLVELGLDRFGDNVADNRYSARAGVIRFRIGDFERRVQELQQRCTADAWKSACAGQAPPTTCAGGQVPQLKLESFQVQSEDKLMTVDNGVNFWQFTYEPSRPLPRPPELLGNVTVRLSGTIVLQDRKKEQP